MLPHCTLRPLWKSGCNCEVSVYLRKNAGHVGLFHRTSKQLTKRILNVAR